MVLFQCEPSFPSPLASGPSSPQHKPLQCISEDSATDQEGVKFTLDEELDIPEEGQDALEELEDGTTDRNSSVFDELDCQNPPPLNETGLKDPNHNLATTEAKVDHNSHMASKRPLGASKSVPLPNIGDSHRKLLVGVRSENFDQCVPARDGEQCVDDPNLEFEPKALTKPVAPPRRKKSLFKTLAKRKDQDDEQTVGNNSHSNSDLESLSNQRMFHSESDMQSDMLRALADAVAAEEALTATVNSEAAGPGIMTTDGKEGTDPATPPPRPKPPGASFIRRLSTKMKIIVKRSNYEDEDCEDCRRRSKLDEKFEMQDLTSDEDVRLPVTRKVTYYSHVTAGMWADD